MQKNCRWRSTKSLIALLILTLSQSITGAMADEAGSSEASEYVKAGRAALENDEYLAAAVAYRKAAQESDSAELARKATRLAFSYRFDDEALLAAKRWRKLDKESIEARAYLGQLYFRTDDLRAARREFKYLINEGDEEPGARLLSLVSYLSEDGLPERADELMRSLAKPYKDSAMAHYAVAILALRAGDSAHARERAKQAIELDPDYVRPKLLYARTLMFDEDTDGAIEYLAKMIGDSPQADPDARMELAMLYMMDDRDDDALSQVNQILLEHSGRFDALRLMAIINFRLERLDAAWADFEDLLETGQYSMDALYYLGRISDYREQYRRAVRFYEGVNQGGNALYAQRRAAALLAHQLDDVDGAMQLLDDYAATASNHAVEVIELKAQLLVSLERYDEGLALYDKSIEYRPDNESLRLGRSDLLLRAGRLDEAIAYYRKTLKRWPDSALTLNALGYTLADKTDQYEEAEKLIRDALERDPKNPAIIDSMGWVLYRLGQHEAALEQLELAYEQFQDHEVAAHIVEVMAELGRNDEALEVLVAAEKEFPDSDLLADVRKRYFDEAP